MSKRRVCGLIAGRRRSGSSTDLSITVSGDFAFAHCYLPHDRNQERPRGLRELLREDSGKQAIRARAHLGAVLHGWHSAPGIFRRERDREVLSRIDKEGRVVTKESRSTAKDEPFPRGVSKPAQRALASAGYARLNQLTTARESDLAALHGMGPKALNLLKEALKREGKTFRT